ncbi:MAG: D-alanyl-D-alanine carboxypeptidase/D-alanyl-D-alanine-endopeptidase [Deltaproteobacteria bacterium]|nr:D-alanyl-D-alanine carboxypeptidase/D-alanyl-D-alanine-endopeptidase [Nannocystaceae bacterium]
MRRSARWLLAFATLLGALVWLAQRWYRAHTWLPVVDTLGLEQPEPAPRLSLTIIPLREREPTAAELLEQRLAALAADVEERKRTRAPAGLVEFDVEGLSAELATILAGVGDAAQFSIHIRDLRTGHVLFDDFGDTPLNPASNQKLLTSAAALELLGADYTFVTRVLRDDTRLFLVGEGDPQLGVDDLRVLAGEVVASSDVTSFAELVVDDSAFSHDRLAPGYDRGGPGPAYEAESSALSVGYNFVTITAAAQAGQVVVTTLPSTRAIVIDNRARIGSRRKLTVRTLDRGGDTVVEVRGTLNKRGPAHVVNLRIHDPARVAGSLFTEALAELSASQPLRIARGVAPETAEELAQHESVTLLEILDLGLAYSNNFIAEQVLRTLAWRMTGEPGDWAAGQDILLGYWSALGNDPDRVVVENGSGLSRNGRLTTEGLVDLIAMATRGADPGRGLIDALPVAGEEGTLRSRLRLSGKRVRAKTGTLFDVSGLTGVITAEDGTPVVAFSILINAIDVQKLDAPVRRAIEDRIVTATLSALDDYEARLTGIVPATAIKGARPRAPWRAVAPAGRSRP